MGQWPWIDPDDVRDVAERTLEVFRNRSVEIVEVEDHFGKAGAGGYRDFQINLRLPRSRVIGELQVHVKDLLLVKQRVGHGVYERARVACAALDMGIVSTEISLTCSRNSGVMRWSYNHAFRRATPARVCAPGRVRRVQDRNALTHYVEMPHVKSGNSFKVAILQAIWRQHGFCSFDRRHLAG